MQSPLGEGKHLKICELLWDRYFTTNVTSIKGTAVVRGKPGSGVKERGKVAPGCLSMTQKHPCFYQHKEPNIPKKGAGSVFGILSLTRASGRTPSYPQIFTFKTP